MKVLVVQKGSRERFLAARALLRRDMLAGLVTDWFPGDGPLSTAVRRLPWRSVTRLFDGVSAAGIPRPLVRSLNVSAILSRARLSRAARRGRLGEATLRDDTAFARRVASMSLPPHDAVFCYGYAALEVLRAARAAGRLAVLDQLDPGLEEDLILREEERRHPAYVLHPRDVPPAYYERMKAEWREADLIVVNSEWSRDCILKHGAPGDRVAVVPLAYEARAAAGTPRAARRPVRVLWLGRVTLQKGIPYLVEAARRLVSAPVEILVAGEPSVRLAPLREAPDNLRLLGKVTAARAVELYGDCDVFVLPTLSDGFALTQLEAMAHGMPVIATRHCGRVVEDGVNGFLIPPSDADALAAAILRFVQTPELRAAMGAAGIRTAARFTVDRYADELAGLLTRCRRKPDGDRLTLAPGESRP